MAKLKIDKVIYTAKPDKEGRLEKEMRVYELLDELHIPYERLDHEATMSVDSCEEVERILNIKICKNLFLCNRPKNIFYMLMMLGNKKFKSGNISKQIGSSRLSFADEEYMEEFLDIKPDSVSILGLMNDINNNVKLLVDKDLLKEEYIGCHPCINTSSLKIKTEDIFSKFLSYVNHEVTYVDVK